jgi:hypothetical protein
VSFEDYLISKKIDSDAFKVHEGEIWESWKKEFDELHPTSFTAQKLYLINPIRRKYQLKSEIASKTNADSPGQENTTAMPNASEVVPPPNTSESPKPPVKPAMARPVVRPKPKLN